MGEERRPRWRSRVVLLLACVIVATGLAAASTFSGVFGARTLDVEGAMRLTEGEILDRAGLRLGVNVFHLDTATVRDRLLADPWIASAEVARDLPSTVRVRVVERIPVGTAGAFVLAGDGTVLPGAEQSGLPAIELASGVIDEEGAASGAAVLASLRLGMRREVTGVLILGDGDIVLDIGGMQVRWGPPGDDAAKAAALDAVLRSGQGASPPTMVDVSAPATPAVTFAR